MRAQQLEKKAFYIQVKILPHRACFDCQIQWQRELIV